MTDDTISDEEYERSAFQVVPIASLPAMTGVNLVGWPGAQVDWRSVTRVAIAIFNVGVDPLDESAIRQEVRARLHRRDRSWAVELFMDPIAIYAISRRWSNGRHR